MLVSSTSMNAPRATTTAISQGLYLGRQTSRSSVIAAELILRNLLEVHVRHHIHARSKPTILVLPGIENDLYRDPLHNLHVIPRSILRRKQTEYRTGCPRDAVHMAFQSASARIHMDFRFLSNLHVPELGLFEIGGDPDFIEGNHSEELLPVLNIHPDDHGLIHFAGDRSDDFRVSEI